LCAQHGKAEDKGLFEVHERFPSSLSLI